MRHAPVDVVVCVRACIYAGVWLRAWAWALYYKCGLCTTNVVVLLQMWALYHKCGRGPSTTNAHRYNCLGTRKALPRPKRRVPARTERRCTRASTPPRMHATADREHCTSG